MPRLTRDPDLDQLVRSLNTAAGPAGEPEPEPAERHWPAAEVPEGNAIEQSLIEVVRRGASDLLLVAGAPPVLRLAGRLVNTTAAVLTGGEIESLMASFLTLRIRERLQESGAADFSLRLNPRSGDDDLRAWRFRVNVHRQRGTLAVAFRALPTGIPTLEKLNLPPSLAELVKPSRGLVLICGPTGSGKTSTLAALVGHINATEAKHVVTIEDPIEYDHGNVSSLIEQIEVGRDAPSFAAALRASLRQDPDVILVGEMRDLETASIALTAAETGHLILSTLHTSDAPTAIHRIVDVFPPQQQQQIRQQLALSLNAIVCQTLVPLSDGSGRTVAVEVLLANHAVRNHIRLDKLQNLASELTLGRRQGMISLEDSLARLVRQGRITLEDARARSGRLDELESLLRTR